MASATRNAPAASDLVLPSETGSLNIVIGSSVFGAKPPPDISNVSPGSSVESLTVAGVESAGGVGGGAVVLVVDVDVVLLVGVVVLVGEVVVVGAVVLVVDVEVVLVDVEVMDELVVVEEVVVVLEDVVVVVVPGPSGP